MRLAPALFAATLALAAVPAIAQSTATVQR